MLADRLVNRVQESNKCVTFGQADKMVSAAESVRVTAACSEFTGVDRVESQLRDSRGRGHFVLGTEYERANGCAGGLVSPGERRSRAHMRGARQWFYCLLGLEPGWANDCPPGNLSPRERGTVPYLRD